MSLILLVRYQVNKEYIAAFLCENRDKPEMHCEGKCHLKKTLTTHEKLIHSLVGLLNENFNSIAVTEVFQVDLSSSPRLVVLDWPIEEKQRYVKDYNQEIFHPPCQSLHA